MAVMLESAGSTTCTGRSGNSKKTELAQKRGRHRVRSGATGEERSEGIGKDLSYA